LRNTILLVFLAFIGIFFGAISLAVMAVGNAASVVFGLLFLLATIFTIRWLYGDFVRNNEALDKRDALEEERRVQQEKIRQNSTSVKTWANSTATLIENIENEQGVTKSRLEFGKLNFCPYLTNVTSLIIRCPKCKHTFPRFYYQPEVHFNKEQLKEGTLSATEILRNLIQTNGFPSEIHCTQCGETIYRSREPRGQCSFHNKVVRGEKLFCCTINQCTG